MRNEKFWGFFVFESGGLCYWGAWKPNLGEFVIPVLLMRSASVQICVLAVWNCILSNAEIADIIIWLRFILPLYNLFPSEDFIFSKCILYLIVPKYKDKL